MKIRVNWVGQSTYKFGADFPGYEHNFRFKVWKVSFIASVGCSDAPVCCESQEYWSQSKDKTQTAFLASVWETDWCTVLLNTRMLVIVKTQESWSQSKRRPYLCSPRTQVDATHTSWAQIQRHGTSHVCFSKEDTVLPASPQEDFSKANFPPGQGQLQRREAWFWWAKKCRSMPEQCHCHTEHRTLGHKYNIRFQSKLPPWPAGTCRTMQTRAVSRKNKLVVHCTLCSQFTKSANRTSPIYQCTVLKCPSFNTEQFCEVWYGMVKYAHCSN